MAPLSFTQKIALATIEHIIENTYYQLVRNNGLLINLRSSENLGDSAGLRDAEHWQDGTWSWSSRRSAFGSFLPLFFAEPPR